MALTVNKLFVRVPAGYLGTNGVTRDSIVTKSATDNKVYFLVDTNEIIARGTAFGLSTTVAAEIEKIKSILSTFFADGSEDAVKAAIDAVQAHLDAEVADRKAKAFHAVAYDAASKSIKFSSADGAELGSVKASDIIGNHVVKSSAYDADNNTLTLTFEGAEADVDVNIDLGQMLDMNDVISGDTAHFTADYANKKLTLAPVVGKLAGDAATAGLADAEEARAYVDAAIADVNADFDAYKAATDARLDVLEGDGDGSVAKALADAKAFTTQEVTAEKDRATAVEQTLTETLADEVTRATAAEKEIQDALADPATFWEDYTA